MDKNLSVARRWSPEPHVALPDSADHQDAQQAADQDAEGEGEDGQAGHLHAGPIRGEHCGHVTAVH